MRMAILAAALAGLAAPALAQEPTAEARAALVAAIEAAGCKVNEGNADAILAAAGIDEAAAEAVVYALTTEELVDLTDEGLVLKTPGCI